MEGRVGKNNSTHVKKERRADKLKGRVKLEKINEILTETAKELKRI